MSKTHVKGTNNRTFCGRIANEKTKFVCEDQEAYTTTCDSCLGRLTDDTKYMIECLKRLRAIESEK